MTLTERRSDAADPAKGELASAPWGIGEIAGALVAVMAALVTLFTALSYLLRALGFSDEQDGPGASLAIVLGQIALDAIAVGVAAALSLGKYRLSGGAWGLRRRRPIDVAMCAGALVVAFAIMALYSLIVSVLGLDALEPNQDFPDTLFSDPLVLPFAFVLIVLVAPVSEELFFRAFIFLGLRGRPDGDAAGPAGRLGRLARSMQAPLARLPIGPRTLIAGLISGGMWAAIHGEIGLLVPITLIGLTFALLVARTGSLWNAILVHGLFNLIGFAANVASQRSA